MIIAAADLEVLKKMGKELKRLDGQLGNRGARCV